MSDLRQQVEDTNDDLKHVSPSPGDPAHEAHHAKTDEIRALLQDNPDLKDCIYSNLEERDYVLTSGVQAVAVDARNFAVNKCRDVPGWSSSLLDRYRLGYWLRPLDRNWVPPESRMQSSKEDLWGQTLQTGKKMLSYFKTPQGKPYTGAGAIPQGALLRPRSV
ncbi:MAG: hypothetical protein M1815_001273 [Lichina confinis]|nr:MAG: hypothetical protein M1815_001273 [Lichina confinis]